MENSKDPLLEKYRYNNSLKDLPEERWEEIIGFDNYAVSNYGRIKSLERWTVTSFGRERLEPELIMKPFHTKYFNKHLGRTFYSTFCSLSLDGKKYRRSIPRFVYYHFVEKFDLNDRLLVISFKDSNSLNLHYSNLELITIGEQRQKMFRKGRARSWKSDTRQATDQYAINGDFVASYESIHDAAKTTGINSGSILYALTGKSFTAGGFRWFEIGYKPGKKDFLTSTANKVATPDGLFNISLWHKLGKPRIDRSNPPACMNLSLKSLRGERWKPIPGYETQFNISNKGRIKRLSGWTSGTKQIFWGEQIVALKCGQPKGSSQKYLSAVLNKDGKKTQISLVRLLYHCFIDEAFDLNDKTVAVDNRNDPAWNISLSKLKLLSASSLLKLKRAKQ